MSIVTQEEAPGRITKFIDDLMTRLQPVWDRLIILEPERWIIAITLLASGQASVHSSNQEELFWHMSFNLSTMFDYIAVLLILSASAIGRNLVRRKRSLDLGPENRLAGLDSQDRVWPVTSYVLLALGVIMSATWGPLGVIYSVALYLISGGIEQLTAQSNSPVKPYRIAEYLGITTLLLMIGWHVNGGVYAQFGAMITPYLFAIVAVSLLLIIEPFNHVTEGATIEPQSTYGWALLFISTLLVVAAVVGGYINRDPVISTGAILAIPFYLVAIAYRRIPDIARTIRYSVILLIIFVGARYPYVFPATLMLFYVIRFHYHNRFNLNFPAFSPEST